MRTRTGPSTHSASARGGRVSALTRVHSESRFCMTPRGLCSTRVASFLTMPLGLPVLLPEAPALQDTVVKQKAGSAPAATASSAPQPLPLMAAG